MNLTLALNEVNERDRLRVGGKGFALAMMAREGMAVPGAVCITTEAYDQYMRATGLRDKLAMALYRKAFKDMRWEEIWDTALRIRNLFLKTAIPADLSSVLAPAIQSHFNEKAVSVRSSAPGEDSSKSSFAGLHESYVNVRGREPILEHVRLVWASLWSDRALLYRQELGLDVEKSAMAVVVQEMISGDRSGVVFGRSPVDESQAVVEAVYGLNQGLVDGTVEPDRWILRRNTGQILSHSPALREKVLKAVPSGTRLEPLAHELKEKAPLTEGEVSDVYRLAMKAESLFKSPQDVEWTYRMRRLHTLQARPITTGTTSEGDQRPWYLSLHRSFDNLKGLRTKIENELIPAMEAEAARLAGKKVTTLSDPSLADEIEKRLERHKEWHDVYWRDCIPFAHGMRLFGQVYNDIMQPADPFEFMDVLKGERMVSIQRNERMEDLASWLRKDPQLRACLTSNKIEDCDPAFRDALDELTVTFGDLSWGDDRSFQDPRRIAPFLLEMADRPPAKASRQAKKGIPGLEKKFLARFQQGERAYAAEMIDLARASYRLRDDDNIYLGKIEGQMLKALQEGKRRIDSRYGIDVGSMEAKDVVEALRNEGTVKAKGRGRAPKKPKKSLDRGFQIKARQIVGQPAGPGVASGKARVVLEHGDLFQFKAGEILVCDAVDPNMTFVVPLATAIVERRGGMLIHGAIIAREYGLPCVTGVAEAAKWIKTGDTVTVDGYLGIVIIGDADT